jgi:hypothetical protein
MEAVELRLTAHGRVSFIPYVGRVSWVEYEIKLSYR